MTGGEFWARIAPPDDRGCTVWTGAQDQNGYGRLHFGGRQARAHRVAFELATGVAPGALMVCHSCDNPGCCNPAHLWLGDNRANQMDCTAKGRRPKSCRVGQDNGRAKITEAQAREVIALIASGRKNIEIATAYGITHANVSAIRLGKSWPNLPRPENDNFRRYASLRA